MATQLQLRRGTTAENDVFTGAPGELTMDTDTNGLRIHDGNTTGGFDVPTAATADYVVEWQAPTDLNNYTWYRKYKSGWVEQGGYKEITMSVNGADNVITLPVVMSTSYYTIDVTLAGTYGGRTISAQKSKATTTTITVGGYVSSGTESNSCYWQVSGMAA